MWKRCCSQAIHESSKREGKLVNVNCAAIPSEFLESELFGHEKGSFTGADSLRRVGLKFQMKVLYFLMKLVTCQCLCKQNY